MSVLDSVEGRSGPGGRLLWTWKKSVLDSGEGRSDPEEKPSCTRNEDVLDPAVEGSSASSVNRYYPFTEGAIVKAALTSSKATSVLSHRHLNPP
jgi:hypothetical protein